MCWASSTGASETVDTDAVFRIVEPSRMNKAPLDTPILLADNLGRRGRYDSLFRSYEHRDRDGRISRRERDKYYRKNHGREEVERYHLSPHNSYDKISRRGEFTGVENDRRISRREDSLIEIDVKRIMDKLKAKKSIAKLFEDRLHLQPSEEYDDTTIKRFSNKRRNIDSFDTKRRDSIVRNKGHSTFDDLEDRSSVELHTRRRDKHSDENRNVNDDRMSTRFDSSDFGHESMEQRVRATYANTRPKSRRRNSNYDKHRHRRHGFDYPALVEYGRPQLFHVAHKDGDDKRKSGKNAYSYKSKGLGALTSFNFKSKSTGGKKKKSNRGTIISVQKASPYRPRPYNRPYNRPTYNDHYNDYRYKTPFGLGNKHEYGNYNHHYHHNIPDYHHHESPYQDYHHDTKNVHNDRPHYNLNYSPQYSHHGKSHIRHSYKPEYTRHEEFLYGPKYKPNYGHHDDYNNDYNHHTKSLYYNRPPIHHRDDNPNYYPRGYHNSYAGTPSYIHEEHPYYTQSYIPHKHHGFQSHKTHSYDHGIHPYDARLHATKYEHHYTPEHIYKGSAEHDIINGASYVPIRHKGQSYGSVTKTNIDGKGKGNIVLEYNTKGVKDIAAVTVVINRKKNKKSVHHASHHDKNHYLDSQLDQKGSHSEPRKYTVDMDSAGLEQIQSVIIEGNPVIDDL